MGHYQYRLKCMSCSLHYIVCSWNDDWLSNTTPVCPECGHKGSSFALRVSEMKEQIYEVVPGSDGTFPFPISEEENENDQD